MKTSKFAEINRRYKTPQIQMSPAVKLALLALRLYLLLLIVLLVVKFISLLK
ncbi:hypothetical protein [uncultured Thiodictyon sp.]|uniref:hypothetical protein n=1 Tax=uncultured Thiodictyon sp. TaxID=1846217 RepID=UPI0025F0DF7B|nr:hypothetical protein [uncultured Thiodictyon sp.]